jgi:hypothetical protein
MRVFISHAAKDRQLASRLAAELSHAGFSVWDAAEEIAPGDNWAKKIGEALDESDVMIALVTQGSLESEALRADIHYGLTTAKFEQRLVPVLVGFVTFVAGKDVPWILLKLDPVYVESRDSGFESVIRRVRSVLGRESQQANAACAPRSWRPRMVQCREYSGRPAMARRDRRGPRTL